LSPAVVCPFDGRVRPLREERALATSRREVVFVTKRASARDNRAGETSVCISLAAKRADATGTGEAGACAEPAAWRCGTPQGQRDERMRYDRTNRGNLAVVFKLRFTEDSALEDTQAYRFFRAKPVARWPPADGQPTTAIRWCVTGCDWFAGRQRTDGPRRWAVGDVQRADVASHLSHDLTMSDGISDSAFHTTHERPNV